MFQCVCALSPGAATHNPSGLVPLRVSGCGFRHVWWEKAFLLHSLQSRQTWQEVSSSVSGAGAGERVMGDVLVSHRRPERGQCQSGARLAVQVYDLSQAWEVEPEGLGVQGRPRQHCSLRPA